MSKFIGEYRVVDSERPDGTRQFSIRRVVTNEADNKILDVTEEIYPSGATIGELQADMDQLQQALSRPVLVDPLVEADWDLVLGDEED